MHNDDSSDLVIDTNLQAKMNQPPIDPNGFQPDTEKFIRDVMSRVFSGEINLHDPQSLIIQDEYAKCPEIVQGKADINAVNFCSKLREIKDLMDISGGETMFVNPTYQLNALVQELKYKKEQFETTYGNIFKI
jgi:hypothetical protein